MSLIDTIKLTLENEAMLDFETTHQFVERILKNLTQDYYDEISTDFRFHELLHNTLVKKNMKIKIYIEQASMYICLKTEKNRYYESYKHVVKYIIDQLFMIDTVNINSALDIYNLCITLLSNYLITYCESLISRKRKNTDEINDRASKKVKK